MAKPLKFFFNFGGISETTSVESRACYLLAPAAQAL